MYDKWIGFYINILCLDSKKSSRVELVRLVKCAESSDPAKADYCGSIATCRSNTTCNDSFENRSTVFRVKKKNQLLIFNLLMRPVFRRSRLSNFSDSIGQPSLMHAQLQLLIKCVACPHQSTRACRIVR